MKACRKVSLFEHCVNNHPLQCRRRLGIGLPFNPPHTRVAILFDPLLNLSYCYSGLPRDLCRSTMLLVKFKGLGPFLFCVFLIHENPESCVQLSGFTSMAMRFFIVRLEFDSDREAGIWCKSYCLSSLYGHSIVGMQPPYMCPSASILSTQRLGPSKLQFRPSPLTLLGALHRISSGSFSLRLSLYI